MPDSGVEIFETRVTKDSASGTVYDANPASHVAVADIAFYKRGLLFLRIVPAQSDPGVPVVMHDVVDDPSAHTIRPDAGNPETSDVFMKLVCAPSSVMLPPSGIVVTPDVCHGESINNRVLRHRYSRGRLFACRENTTSVDHGALGTRESDRTLPVIAGAPETDTWLEPDALAINASAHNDFVARGGCIDRSLNRPVIPWNVENGSFQAGSSQSEDQNKDLIGFH